ncbi:hypothetical protein G3N96_06980 [Burkholderia sp. Se-20373]|uniref:hypothetical protein n=1 Tax=Burkholderia sp. Se-20373 TaxID=2703898 RepID=UPI0019826CBD|nr:hypothetical protein [Burkholderia sp. Se-20373]MBN3745179.1 hypothetical protein [Burkholderia sp. Se-20373]
MVFSLARLNTGSIDSARKVFFLAAIGLKTPSHGTASSADDINPLARETFSFANTHFQARRLCPGTGAYADWKEGRIWKLIY